MSKERITLVLEGDEMPSFNFSQEVLGCKIVSAEAGDAIADRDQWKESAEFNFQQYQDLGNKIGDAAEKAGEVVGEEARKAASRLKGFFNREEKK